MNPGDLAPRGLFSGYESPGPSWFNRMVAIPRERGHYMNSVAEMLKFVDYLGHDFAGWSSVGSEVWADNCDLHISTTSSTQ